MDLEKFLNEIMKNDEALEKYIDEQQEEIEEISTTTGMPGYNIPGAFSKNPKKPKNSGAVLGYTEVDVEKNKRNTVKLKEGSYKDYKTQEGTSKQKVQRAIAEMNSQLFKLERAVKQNIKLKQESGLSSDTYNNATRAKLTKISERLIKLSEHIRKMGE